MYMQKSTLKARHKIEVYERTNYCKYVSVCMYVCVCM